MQPVEFAQAIWDMGSQPDVARTVEHVLAHARTFTPAAEVGIFRVLEQQQVEIAGTSGAHAQRADELQLHYGEGPCLQAALHSDVCLLSDTRRDSRWPRLAPAVAELGWGSILSLPLATGDTAFGALNLYARRTASFADSDVEWAAALARHAAVALGLRIAEEGLRRAMSDQHVLGQAKGILMERYGLDRERAQTVLEQHARTGELSVAAVAREVIATRRLPS